MKGPRSHGDCEPLAAETHGEEEEGILGCRDRERRVKDSGCRNARGRLKDCCLQRQKEMKDQGFLAAETEGGTVRQFLAAETETGTVRQFLAAEKERGTVRQFQRNSQASWLQGQREEQSGNSCLQRQKEMKDQAILG